MSISSAKDFMEKMKNDKEFAKKINEFKNPTELQGFVTKAGFDFTKEELNSLSTELSDDDLEKVAGGVRICDVAVFW